MKKQIFTLIFGILNVYVYAQLSTSSFPAVTKLSTSTRLTGAVYDGHIYYAETNASTTNPAGSVGHFDGANWVPLFTSSTGLASTVVFDIAQHKGVFYFGTNKGISVKDGTKWTIIDFGNSNLASETIYKIYSDDDIMVAATSIGISYKLHTSSSWINLSNSDLSIINGGTLNSYMSRPIYQNGIIYFNSINTINSINIRSAIITKLFDVKAIGFSISRGKVFALSLDSGLLVLDSNTASVLTNNELCKNSGFETHVYANLFSDVNENLFYHSAISWSDNTARLVAISSDKQYGGLLENEVYNSSITNTLSLVDLKTNRIYVVTSGKSFKAEDYLTEVAKPPKGTGILAINNMSVPVNNIGDFSREPIGGIKQEEAPKGSCKLVNFQSALWIGGYDSDSTIHLAAMTYRQRGQDFWPGPLDKLDGSFYMPHERVYDRVWDILKEDITKHILLAKNGVVKQSETTDAIWNWPGNGANGAADQLAPYIDINNNGIYEPALGDYPNVPGDQCIYWIMNDNAYGHTESGAVALGVEIHGMAYAYNCDANGGAAASTQNTVFYKYKIYNRSEIDYTDVAVGHWKDIDIGYFSDDYVGCHVTQNIGYGYNGDDYDETDKGYGANAPMTATLVLDAPTKIDDGVDGDGDGSIDEADEKRMLGCFVYYNNSTNTVNGNPGKASDFYNYMTGKWKTGSRIKHGGDGVTGGITNTSTCYMFSGETNPDQTGNWTEASDGNSPSDRRYVASTYTFDLGAGENVNVEFANIYARNESQYDQLPQMLEYVDYIKSWYFREGHPSCFHTASVGEAKKVQAAGVYPNPATGSLTIVSPEIIETISVFNLSGQECLHQEYRGEATQRIDISSLAPGIYLLTTTTKNAVLQNKVVKY